MALRSLIVLCGEYSVERESVMMKKKIRKNQQIFEKVLFNGEDILIMMESRPYADRKEVRDTVVILCNGRLKVGTFYDSRDNYTAYFVLGCDPGMHWKNYNKYFPNASVVKCYMKMGADPEDVAKMLARFISKISGRVILNQRMAELLGEAASEYEVVAI